MLRVMVLALSMGLAAASSVAQTATPEPTPSPTPSTLTLTLWLPEPLAVPDDTESQEVINAQIEAFLANEPNVIVEKRLKKVGEIGGIMSTLRAASSVAPGALPDLTLIRRQDLVTAARDGLIESMEGKVPSAVLGGLNSALPLGQVNNQLYGVPYLIDLEHVIYRLPPDSEVEDIANWDYPAVLARGMPIVFPAGRATGMNDVLYLQYVAAGGELAGDSTLILNDGALRTTLEFYEQARDAGVVTPDVINYTTPTDYFQPFLDGRADAAVFFSSRYLQMAGDEPALLAAPIPTPDGQATGILNGWMWVLVASEPEQQDLALRYLNFVMQPENQTAYARTVDMLPSQRPALLALLPPGANAELYTRMLDNAILPLGETEGGALARALQENVVAILNGERTAEEAIELILTQPAN
jgi:ABC-type glycerol-3-phosphate transport system substrate-binding protein